MDNQTAAGQKTAPSACHAVPCLLTDLAHADTLAALTFKAAVDDPVRLKGSRTVAAHFGLTAQRYQSGERDNPDRISNASDRDVRMTLVAAANFLLMRTMAGSQIKFWACG